MVATDRIAATTVTENFLAKQSSTTVATMLCCMQSFWVFDIL